MILVVADDTSGAAELAAAATARGYTVELRRNTSSPAPTVDVVVYDTQTRSLDAAAAIATLHPLWPIVRQWPVTWCFKKIDSVLRGHVAIESCIMAHELGFRSVWICPANPSRHRVVAGGQLTIGGQPAHRTSFRFDPEYPLTTSSLSERLRNELASVAGQPCDVPITALDATSLDDLRQLAAALPDNVLAAGASDFFSALLDKHHGHRATANIENRWPATDRNATTVLVCGSKQAWGARVEQCQELGIPTFALRATHLQTGAASSSAFEALAQQASDALQQASHIAIGIDSAIDTCAGGIVSPQLLVARLARLVCTIFAIGPVSRLLVEGGSTASHVLDCLGYHSLQVIGRCDELAVLSPRGASTPQIIIKPGSYDWPTSLFEPFKKACNSRLLPSEIVP